MYLQLRCYVILFTYLDLSTLIHLCRTYYFSCPGLLTCSLLGLVGMHFYQVLKQFFQSYKNTLMAIKSLLILNKILRILLTFIYKRYQTQEKLTRAFLGIMEVKFQGLIVIFFMENAKIGNIERWKGHVS